MGLKLEPYQATCTASLAAELSPGVLQGWAINIIAAGVHAAPSPEGSEAPRRLRQYKPQQVRPCHSMLQGLQASTGPPGDERSSLEAGGLFEGRSKRLWAGCWKLYGSPDDTDVSPDMLFQDLGGSPMNMIGPGHSLAYWRASIHHPS